MDYIAQVQRKPEILAKFHSCIERRFTSQSDREEVIALIDSLTLANLCELVEHCDYDYSRALDVIMDEAMPAEPTSVSPDSSMSMVALCGESSSECGYCHGGIKSRFTFGCVARYLSVAHYQMLIDRGWRRSGTYLYLPDNQMSCCPNLPIRLPALRFTLSKSHRKIEHRVRQYMKSRSSSSPDDSLSTAPGANIVRLTSYLRCAIEHSVRTLYPECATSFSMDSVKLTKFKSKKDVLTCNVAHVLANLVPVCAINEIANRVAASLNQHQLLDQSNGRLIPISCDGRSFLHFSVGLDPSLSSVEQSSQATASSKGTSHDGILTTEWKSKEFTEEAYQLYKKYQMTVHKDEESAASASQYRRFLCESPLVSYTDQTSGIEFGTFHLHYRIGSELIAVSVIDVLPKCLSSVYFFYDERYSFLSLGTFSALTEINLVRSFQLKYPSLAYYYLGFYVHNCQKMAYKRHYRPSELLCTDSLTWHPLDECVSALDKDSHACISRAAPTVCEDISMDDISSLLPAPANPGSETVDDIVLALGHNRFINFDQLTSEPRQEFFAVFQQFFDAVGPDLARQIVVDMS